MSSSRNQSSAGNHQNSTNTFRKRSREEIIKDTVPVKSKKLYEATWDEFIKFSVIEAGVEPSETQYLQFLDFLWTEKRFTKSTLWVKYSHLNAVHTREFGRNFKDFPALKLLIKSYPNSLPKQAATFNQEQIQRFMSEDFTDDRFHLIRQAIVSLCFCGGLRMIEARGLNIEDLQSCEEGYRVTHRSSKEKQKITLRSFLIPAKCETPYAERITQYLNLLKKETDVIDGPLFRGCSGGARFVSTPLGQNKLREVGKDVAKFLGLANPDDYTGHCFRRSAATIAASNCASTTNLQTHFGWNTPTTAMVYIESNEKTQDLMAEKITGEKMNVEHQPMSNEDPRTEAEETVIQGTEENNNVLPGPVNESKKRNKLKLRKKGKKSLASKTITININ